MKGFLVFIFSVWQVSDLVSQSYNIGHRQITFTDAARQDRQIQTEVYYPSFSGGDDVPVASDMGAKFPVLVFGHGFVMEWGAYANFWNTLVPHGYIIAFPRTESGLAPDHTAFGQDLAFLVKALQLKGEDPGSPFYNAVDTTSCVMGHSMGGGSSFLAAQYNAQITAIANFAAAETNPSAIAACRDIQVPVLIFAGANDCITPPDVHQRPMYDTLPSVCKTLVTVTGASHCQFAEQNVFCSFGELTCAPPPAISRDRQHSLVDTLLLPWLDYQLKGKCEALAEFQNILESSTEWTINQVCEPCIPVRVTEAQDLPRFRLFPIPASGYFYLESALDIQTLIVRIYTTEGVTVFRQSFQEKTDGLWEIRMNLPPGFYFVEASYPGQTAVLNLVIQ